MFVFVDSVVFIRLMMGEVSLETSPKNIIIQDMINSKTVLIINKADNSYCECNSSRLLVNGPR